MNDRDAYTGNFELRHSVGESMGYVLIALDNHAADEAGGDMLDVLLDVRRGYDRILGQHRLG
jgi:hypothetical protein